MWRICSSGTLGKKLRTNLEQGAKYGKRERIRFDKFIQIRVTNLVYTFKTNLKQGSHSGGKILDKFGAGGEIWKTNLRQNWSGGTNLEQVDNLGRVSKRCRKL